MTHFLTWLPCLIRNWVTSLCLCSQQEFLTSDPIRVYEVFSQNYPLGTPLPKFLLLVMVVSISSFIHFQEYVSYSLCLFPVSLWVLSVSHASAQLLSMAWLPGGHRSPKLLPEVLQSRNRVCATASDGSSVAWFFINIHRKALLQIVLHLPIRETPLGHQLFPFS